MAQPSSLGTARKRSRDGGPCRAWACGGRRKSIRAGILCSGGAPEDVAEDVATAVWMLFGD